MKYLLVIYFTYYHIAIPFEDGTLCEAAAKSRQLQSNAICIRTK